MVKTIRPVPVGIHRRRGVSLIEMVVVISMMTVVIALVGMTFHLLIRSEKMVSQSFLTERTISQLAVQFRDDVHRSETGVITGGSERDQPELVLGNANGIKIRYAVTADGLVRLIVTDCQVTARNDFRLPDCRVSFSSGPDDESSLRRLVIERPGAVLVKKHQESVPFRAMKIDAHLKPKDRLVTATTKVDNNSTAEKTSLENPQ